MNLLEKLDAVEIKTDNRISEADRAFCQSRQNAYDDARQILFDLRQQWKKTVSEQEQKHGKDHYVFLPNFSASVIQERLEELHGQFIAAIVGHFNSIYHVSVPTVDIKGVLLPKEPRKHGWDVDKAAIAAYKKEMRNLVLRYETVLDQIFIQLGGRTFVERALDEIKEKCHKAAWNQYRKVPEFEVKGDTIRFTSYACKFSDWITPEWEVMDGMKDILIGIAHFETGTFGVYPDGFSDLMSWVRVKYSEIDFDCKKIKRLKMFKNNRVDVKFAGKALANQFAEEYLGQML